MNREQRRSRRAEIRAVEDDDGNHYLTLRTITPFVVDDYGSVWMPDVFDASLAERPPTLCWAHSWHEPIGRGVSHERADDEGPVVQFRLDDFEAVPLARRAYAQVDSGTIDDCSVGFSNVRRRPPTDEELERWPGCAEVIERADLDEVSLVVRGAVPGAKVVGVRTANGDATVDLDAVVELGRQVAAGDISHDEAQAALALLSTDPPSDPGAPPPPDPTPTVDELIGDEALDVIDGRSH